MHFLGKITRLQIQRDRLKRGPDGQRVYDPAPVTAVEELTLTAAGACARAADGGYIVDVHNSAHPHTRNHGTNPISFLFTGHYAAMRGRFGERLAVGCAGESILVETEEVVPHERVAGGIVIETKAGRVALGEVLVAAPCKAFSAYALGSPGATPEELKPALQFLDGGMRGFYCRFAGESPAVIEVGDSVFAV